MQRVESHGEEDLQGGPGAQTPRESHCRTRRQAEHSDFACEQREAEESCRQMQDRSALKMVRSLNKSLLQVLAKHFAWAVPLHPQNP